VAPAVATNPLPSVSPCGGPQAVSVSLSSSRAAKPLTAVEECGLKPRDVFKECDKCPEMVVVPAGSFVMGANDPKPKPIESPRHLVTLEKPFAAGKLHITRDQFGAFVGETGYEASGMSCMSGEWRDPGFTQAGNHPVVCVNWTDASAYVAWLSRKTGMAYRLLTEGEWEYAARAGTTTEWFWGDKRIDAKNFAHCWDCSGNVATTTAPAGSLRPNNFGLYDMVGNAYQLVQDCYQANYNNAPADGSAYGSGSCVARVIRGGSWHKTLEWSRSASRFLDASSSMRSNEVGFRVARTLRP
jgi:formylglycine-generating enzyme required for sulfatase activity